VSEVGMTQQFQTASEPGSTGGSHRPLVIAIDGPSGSGKSSTARGVAERLGLAFLDTGAMYRAITWLALQEGVDPDDRAAVAYLLAHASVEVDMDPRRPAIAINGVDVSEAIRAPEVSAAVSAIATNLDVRAELVARQKKLITDAIGGIVAEGRDITTVVAPDADVRVLLVADPAARVARRHAELTEHEVDVDTVTDQVIRRDRDDATVADFESAAPGVHVVDSTSLSLEEVIETICAFVPVQAMGDARDPRG
jgi:CMP/dCMP kinase